MAPVTRPDTPGDRPARLVVCAPASSRPAFFVDDLFGACVLCHTRVRFRPHNPTPRVLVCTLCFLIHAEPGCQVEILGEALAELELYAARSPCGPQ